MSNPASFAGEITCKMTDYSQSEVRLVYPAVKECVKQMPNVTFFSLPGLGHVEAMAHSELVLPHITTFLATVPH